MSRTKRFIEQLMDEGKFEDPSPLKVTLEKDGPNSVVCPCCGKRFEQHTDILDGEFCPKCYFENEYYNLVNP